MTRTHYPRGIGRLRSLALALAWCIILGTAPRLVAQHTATARPMTPYLNEIMANPLAGSAEYIELYNPHPIAIPLTGLSLAIGGELEKLRTYSLAEIPRIPPRSILLLTTCADSILAYYPEAHPEAIVEIRLPRLRNSGCHIHLLYDDQLIDSVHYRPDRLAEGLRSRRGVALERMTVEDTDAPTPLAEWHSALGSLGYASPTERNTLLRAPASDGEASAEGTTPLHRLLSEIKANSPAGLRLALYSTDGLRLMIRSEGQALSWLTTLLHQRERIYTELKSFACPQLILHLHYAGEGYTLKVSL